MVSQTLYRVLGIAGMSGLALVGVVSAQATRSPSSDGMDPLLAEVRGLRAELSQAAGASMRTQLLLGRLSLQEQRITALNRQSSELQQQLTNVTRDRIATTEHLERLTTTLQNNTGPVPEQKELEYQLSALKTRVVEQQQEEQRLQNQFAELSRTIAVEQGRWTDFNSRLDELERSLK